MIQARTLNRTKLKERLRREHRQLFQFTPVESSIAILMMESFGTAAIAKELAITRNTLRDHLKSMFSKTRTRNQSELLHTLLRCPASLSYQALHCTAVAG